MIITAQSYWQTTVRPWGQVPADTGVCHGEVREAVALGELEWTTPVEPIPPDVHPTLGPDHYVYTRQDYEMFVRHTDMSGSGILPSELMTRAQVLAYRDVSPVIVTPEDFVATHDMSVCPTLRVVLTWTADPAEGPIVVLWEDPLHGWQALDTLAAGMEEYVHTYPVEGLNRYMVGYESRAERAAAQTTAICPF